jgi:sugar phosphate isomerase/epimerase
MHDGADLMRSAFSFNCFNNSTHLGLPPSLPDQISAAASAGYDFIGLDVPSLVAHENAGLPPEVVYAQILDHGIDCYELVPLSLSADKATTGQSLAVTTRLAPLVGAKHVLATVRGPVDAVVAVAARHAAAKLADIGVSLSIEFMPVSSLRSLEEAIRLLEMIDDERVGVVIDVWHFVLSGSRWETLASLPTERIGFVQLDDAMADADGTSSEDCMDRRVLPGEGSFPLRQFRDALLNKGYSGVVSVEVLSSTWRARPITDFARETFRAARALWHPEDAREATESSATEGTG